jgi:hypothetical protein
MTVAFLVTSPYQVHHYKQIAPHLADATAVIEVRERDLGASEEFVRAHLPGCEVETVAADRLAGLDGRFRAIVCQTPVLPLEFPRRSYVVAQQYSLAKERYQYGVWRTHAHLNLMYGPYSVEKVRGFCHAVAVGNPLLDTCPDDPPPPRRVFAAGQRRPRILYLPTYGELSSLPVVLPRLNRLDADVTVKLHHAAEAADAGGLDALGPHVRLCGSEADPVALLREHDGVISDFSGAAFDAAYAGLPLVLTGSADPLSADFVRLSTEELDDELLREVAVRWSPGENLVAAFAAAEHMVGPEARQRFRDRLFVNPGRAGAACAREIERLLDEGLPPHFPAEQVRTATRRYITDGRRLRFRASRVAFDELGPTFPLRRPPAPGRRVGRLRRAYLRSRRMLARSPQLRRMVHVVRHWRHHGYRRPASDPRSAPDAHGPVSQEVEPSPAARRETVRRLLAPHLAAEAVALARDSDTPGATTAVLTTQKRGLHRALAALAAQRPDLRVRVGMGADTVDTMPLADLRYFDVVNADWLQVGSARERSAYRLGAAGYLTVLLVAHDRQKNRYITARPRGGRADWTALFPHGGVGRPKRPVAAPVDVVYTWVDSGDPAWRAAHERYRDGNGVHGNHVHNVSADNTERYIDREELRYSMRALWLFAPFVRHIYLVTAGHRPSWLADHPKVTVVPHERIFPDPSVLPTFNSHAIEACLHRIPGLAEHFVYLNDDVFIGREISEDAFFTNAGLAKVRLSPSQYIYEGRPEVSAIPTDWAAYNSVGLVEQASGFTFDRRVMHVPMALRTDVLRELDDKYGPELERTRAARFRSTTDVAVPSMLAQFYGIATGRAVEWPTARGEYIYLDTGRADALFRFDEVLRRTPMFFCINATRHTDVDLTTQARTVHQFLSASFPDPAPWERTGQL